MWKGEQDIVPPAEKDSRILQADICSLPFDLPILLPVSELCKMGLGFSLG